MSQGGASQAGSGYPPDMIRPERIASIPMLSAENKTKFTEGLTKLWAALEANPPGSETHTKATARIKEVSRDIMRQVANWKATQGQQQRPQPQSQQSQQLANQQQQQQQQSQSQPQPQPQPTQGQQHAPQQHQQQNTQHPQQQQQQQSLPQPQQLSQAQQQAAFPLGQQAKTFLNGFKVFPPTNIVPNTPEYENYKRRIMSSLTQLVTMQETSVTRFQQFHEKIQAIEGGGVTPPPEMIQGRDAARMGVQNAKSKIDTVRNENEKHRLAWAEKSKPPQQNNPHPQPQQPQQQNPSPYNQQHAAVNNSGQPISPAINYQQNHNVPMHPGQPIARPPGQQQPYQSPATQGPPQPLSHSDAINQAQRSYSQNQGQGTPTPTSGGQPFNHNQNAALNVGNPKFPIPKQLPASQTTPVPLGPARPTFGGPSNGAPGMMGQPAVQKTPHFILEGEGDRVLSKKKLDELVRQVTGGGEGDGLTPDVEEVR